jgi:hypothetical protein
VQDANTINALNTCTSSCDRFSFVSSIHVECMVESAPRLAIGCIVGKRCILLPRVYNRVT